MKLQTIDLDGPLHYADFGGSGPPLVMLHGLGGSLVNWAAVGPALAARRRVLAPDLLGFGRTPLAGREASIGANVALVARFLERVAGGPVVLVGNSMGGLVAAMTAEAHPARVSKLVLVNAALPPARGAPIDRRVAQLFAFYMTPFLGAFILRRRLAKVGPEGSVRETLRLCGVDPSLLPPGIFAAMVEASHARAAMPWANDAFIRAARSLVLTNARRDRVHAMLRRITAPTLLMQGTRDRLVSLATGEEIARLRPDWTFARLEGVGHVPQLEVPERWLELVGGFLDA